MIADTTYSCVEKLSDLLSVSSFVKSLHHLIEYPDPQIRRRALLLLNEKVEQVSESQVSATDLASFMQLVDKLALMITGTPVPVAGEKKTPDTLPESSVNKQTALLSLEILVRSFASRANETQSRQFLDALKAVLQCLQTTDEQQVVSSSLVCCATFCAQMGVHVLESLPTLMPIVLRLLEQSCEARAQQPADSMEIDDSDENSTGDLELLVQVSALSSLEILVLTLSKFMSPYMPKLLLRVLHPTLLTSGKRQIVSKATNILHLVATNIEIRVILPASTWERARGVCYYNEIDVELVVQSAMCTSRWSSMERLHCAAWCDSSARRVSR